MVPASRIRRFAARAGAAVLDPPGTLRRHTPKPTRMAERPARGDTILIISIIFIV
jgi:hypothetical protein